MIKKSLGEFMMSHYTGGSAVVAGRMDGKLCERMDVRAMPAAAGGAAVVGDE